MLTSFRCEPSPDVCNRLVKRVAARDRDAFRSLYRRLVPRVYRQVEAGLGNSMSAVTVTKAVFVEVWRLAPVSTAWHDDVIGWLSVIAARRTAERAATGASQPVLVGHDELTDRELAAALDVHRVGLR